MYVRRCDSYVSLVAGVCGSPDQSHEMPSSRDASFVSETTFASSATYCAGTSSSSTSRSHIAYSAGVP